MKQKYKTLEKSKLQALVERLAWNKDFGCYTKTGFSEYIWPEIAPFARFIIFFDIDHLHELNERFGSYAPANAMIKESLSIVRGSDYIGGQLNSGDEFIVAMTERAEGEKLDPEGMIVRISAEMERIGISATFAFVPVSTWDLEEAVAPAVEEVKRLKAERGIER